MPHCTEVGFASFLSGGFTTMAVINPPEKKLVKRTSVLCIETKLPQNLDKNINSLLIPPKNPPPKKLPKIILPKNFSKKISPKQILPKQSS